MRRTWLTSRASVSASEPFPSSSAPSAPSSVPLWFISSYRRQHDEKHGRAHTRETTEPGSAWLSPCSPPVEATRRAWHPRLEERREPQRAGGGRRGHGGESRSGILRSNDPLDTHADLWARALPLFLCALCALLWPSAVPLLLSTRARRTSDAEVVPPLDTRSGCDVARRCQARRASPRQEVNTGTTKRSRARSSPGCQLGRAFRRG